MKKTLVLLGLVSMSFAYAQYGGKVGINTQEPKATLHITPNETNRTADTNEGIIVPKLSKARVAKIDNNNLINGTLVFVEGNITEESNDKVSLVDAEGFYYYDGTTQKKWVKVGINSKLNGFENIYTSDGTIDQTHPKRTVNMGTSNLIFERSVTDGGRIGIGIADPEKELHVAGTIQANAVKYDSDARLKKDVKNIENPKIYDLRAVTYHWNEKGREFGGDTKLQYGFIAQEIEKVYPDLVDTDSRGYKSVNYVAVVPLLVKALQDQNKEIQDLKKEVKKLQKAKK